MNAISHAAAALCFVLIGAMLGFLGVINGALLSGVVAFITFFILGIVFFQRAEKLASEEFIARRTFRGRFD